MTGNEIEIRVTAEDHSRPALDAAKRSVKGLEDETKKVSSRLTGLGTETGTAFGTNLTKMASSALISGSPALTAAVVGVAAAAAPGVAALFSGAVVGGAGIGGIIGGVALAARDPLVQAEGKRVGRILSAEFQDAASGFVDPVLRGLEKIGSAGWAARLEPAFDKLAAKVDPLVDGLMGFVDNIIPGLERVGDAAGPVLDVLAQGLPQIGSAVNDFFESISDDPETLANGLELFINAVSDAIEFSGDFIGVLIDIYGAGYKVAEVLGLISEKEILIKKGAKDAGREIEGLGEETVDAEQAMKDFDAAIKNVFGRTMNAREATLRYEQAIDDLADGIRSGRRSLDEHTQAGRDNWELIVRATEAIERNREARVQQGMSIEESSAKYDQELEALRKQLISLGYNKDAVNGYIAELKKVPAEAITEVQLRGVSTALARARDLLGVLRALSGFGFLGVAGAGLAAGAGGLPGHAHGGIIGAASGGVRGGMTWVNEQGTELARIPSGDLVSLPFGSTVIPAGQSQQIMSGATGGSSQTVRLVIDLQGADEDFKKMFRKWVRIDGGGSVQVAFGKN